MAERFHLVVIGAGIVGLAVARELRRRDKKASILLLEKEQDVAYHASGRNSGVLHAGFYYTADSLKAQFTVAGNRALREYCRERALPLNECGKLVVATTPAELDTLHELERRGKSNGSQLEMVSVQRAAEIEPNARTVECAIWSPLTATVDPQRVCQALRDELIAQGVQIRFNCRVTAHQDGTLVTSSGVFAAEKTINCAGLYADRLAKLFGFAKNYRILPFKGLYLNYAKNKTDIRTNIYPVPDIRNPFLGVHFTKKVDGTIKIGPTAIPAFWRENYEWGSRFELRDCAEILADEARLFIRNSFGFRSLAFSEMRKYSRSYLIALAAKLVNQLDANGFGDFSAPGIRAQLLEVNTLKLVQDFVVEGDGRSVHVLNAVSPAFTCSFPFAEHIVENFVLR
jgi:(S)-2-hydroxyglutarate dehydrogenase